jgi:hypothetical protein
MFSRCYFCHHANPPGAKYCNACGSSLGLTPRERCDLVNDIDAQQCRPCAGELPQPSPSVTTEPTNPVEQRELGSSVVRALEAVKADLTRKTGVVIAAATRPARPAGRFAVLATAFSLAVFGAILYAIEQNQRTSLDPPASLSSATAGEISVAEKEPHAMDPAFLATRITDNDRADAEQMSRGAVTERTSSTAQSASDEKAATTPTKAVTTPTATNAGDLKGRAQASSKAVAGQHAGGPASARRVTPMIPAATSASSPPPYRLAPAECTAGVVALGLCGADNLAARR